MPTKFRKIASKSSSDAVSLLKQDHKRVKQLLAELEDSESGQHEELLDQIESEIKTHMMIEEEIFYPAFKRAMRSYDDKQLFFEALEEHHITRVVLREIAAADPESEQFEAKAKVLKDLIEHHIEEEEEEMFPMARKAMGIAQLRSLGQAMKSRKEAKPTSTKISKASVKTRKKVA